MLYRLHRLARRLMGLRPLTIALVILGLAGGLASLFAADEALAHWLEPSLVLTLWGMMLFAFIQMFQAIPPPVLPHDDFLTRLVTRTKLALHSVLAGLVLVVTGMLLWMSVRLFTLA